MWQAAGAHGHATPRDHADATTHGPTLLTPRVTTCKARPGRGERRSRLERARACVCVSFVSCLICDL